MNRGMKDVSRSVILLCDSNQVGNALRTMGIGKGDRILIMSPRLPEWWEAVLGIMKIGAISMPGTTLLTPKDVAYRLQAAEAVAVITDAEGAPKVEQVANECPMLRLKILLGAEREGWVNYTQAVASARSTLIPEPTRSHDSMMIYFTSGTVGYPKMVLHTHVSYPLGHIVTGKYWLDLKPTDLHWNLSDTGWAKAAYSNLFGPWSMGAAMFTFDGRGRFDPRQTLELLERYPISTFCAPPTAYRLLVLENLGHYRLTDPTSLYRGWGATEPGGHRGLAARHGTDHPRWLWPNRNSDPGGKLPTPASEAWLNGETQPRFHHRYCG